MEQQAGDSRRITIHSPEDFAGMRRAGQLAAETLDMITPHVRPGVTTGELDRLCHEHILAHGATPAPLGYRGYPKSICTSINHVVCHGIPGERVLAEGDVVNIDVTVILDGWHGDSSRMFFTIEPMVNAGKPDVKILDDGWTAVTRDRSLSAQFEHMVGVTGEGVEIFTISPAGLHRPPYQG